MNKTYKSVTATSALFRHTKINTTVDGKTENLSLVHEGG